MASIAAYVVAAYVLLGLTAWSARGAAAEAVEAAETGIGAAGGGNSEAAAVRLGAAAEIFEDLEERFDGWWLKAGVLAPGVPQNRRALHAMAGEAAKLARHAERAAEVAAAASPRLAGGSVNLPDLARLRDQAKAIVQAAGRSTRALANVRSWLLLPQVAEGLQNATREVSASRADAASLAEGLGTAYSLLGGDGPRRYLVVFMTPSELRGSGGIVGSYAELTATGGRIELVTVGRNDDLNRAGDPAARVISGPPEYLRRYGRWEPATHWQNVTMTPDFPTAGRVMAELYPQSGGSPVDGVIGVDPAGLAALLRLTGPVTTPSWPEPISADNAENVLLFEQYVRFERPDRIEFLEEVARVTFARLTASDVGAVDKAMESLAPALDARRIQLFSTRPQEQEYLREAGVAGAIDDARGDFVAVVNQNASGSKVDHFLSRTLVYDVHFDPATSVVTSSAEVTLENRAPASGLPEYVIGPHPDAGTNPPAGTNRTYLSLYSPLALESVTVDGTAVDVVGEREFGRNVYSFFWNLPAGSRTVVRYELRGVIRSPIYRLAVRAQALATEPEHVTVKMSAPRPWEAEPPPGFTKDGRTLEAARDLEGELAVTVRWRREGG